jgi:hypothetical protein
MYHELEARYLPHRLSWSPSRLWMNSTLTEFIEAVGAWTKYNTLLPEINVWVDYEVEPVLIDKTPRTQCCHLFNLDIRLGSFKNSFRT